MNKTKIFHVQAGSSLTIRLVTAIVFLCIIVDAAIFFPIMANYRASWLDDKLRVAAVAARIFDAAPDISDIPSDLANPFLESIGAYAIVYRRPERTDLVTLRDYAMPNEVVLADRRNTNEIQSLIASVSVFLSPDDRVMRIVGYAPSSKEASIELVMPEQHLKADMIRQALNILFANFIIAMLISATIYVVGQSVLIAPIRKLTDNLLKFRENPENANLIFKPESNRGDEIGVLERSISLTQQELFSLLHQRKHLADLGLAVAKINHDLRNMLSAAQMLSDQVATLPDPKVQRLAPRLVITLDKAIQFAQSVLNYGRENRELPRPVAVDLRALAFEAATTCSLLKHPQIVFENHIPDDTTLLVDPDNLARVFGNLFNNSVEVLEEQGEKNSTPAISISALHDENSLSIRIADNGPGMLPRAQKNLFVPFESSTKIGGTGLGLVIAKELIQANGGTIELEHSDVGTCFVMSFPIDLKV